MESMPSHPRGSASTFKMQEGVPAKADLEDMRLQTDALVSSFNQRCRDATLTPSRLSALHSPNHKSSTQSNTSRSEPSAAVRFPVSSPSNNVVGGATTHALSAAHPKHVTPFSTRQQASAAPSTTSACSSEQIYYRAMLTQAHADTAQTREALVIRDQQLLHANTQIGELRRAIALRDGCLEHASNVVAQLQEHKLYLHSIIDNFRAQQAASKSQLDLQACSLINKERHIFTLTEKIQRMKLESANLQRSCEEALQFMLQECQSASRDRDAALDDMASLRLQIAGINSFKCSSMTSGLDFSSRKAILASLDVGSGPEQSKHLNSSMQTIRAVHLQTTSHGGKTGRDLNIVESPTCDHVVDFYLVHSHDKRLFATTNGIQTSPTGALNHCSRDHSPQKLLDTFGNVSSTRTSQDGPDHDQNNVVEGLALSQVVEDHNSRISSSSLVGSSSSIPASQPNSSTSKSKASLASACIDNDAGLFTNQHRRRTAARSLASKSLAAELKFMLFNIFLSFHMFHYYLLLPSLLLPSLLDTLAASQCGRDVHSPPATPPLFVLPSSAFSCSSVVVNCLTPFPGVQRM
jgi:hypothetical protein